MAPTVYTPPTSTYTKLATITLTGTDSEIVFADIPATYRDLVLVMSARGTRSATVDTVGMRFNGDSGSNYPGVLMFGSGSTAFSFAGTRTGINLDIIPAASTASGTYGSTKSQIMDYSATDKHKTALTRYDTSVDGTGADANRWANTAAITSLTLYCANASFASGSTFSLYGISA